MNAFRFLIISAVFLRFLSQDSWCQTRPTGSVQTGSVSPQPLPLSLAESIDRGLKYNLAVLSGTQEERATAALRLRALYEMYPKIHGDVSSTQEQINLAAFGFSGFPGQPQIVGPFALIDARARMTQSVFDRKLVHELREAKENERAASYANANTRELVVLTVANFYLQALAGASRIEAVEAQVKRSQAIGDRAVDLKNSGLVAGIDVLRSQVELRFQQQRLVSFRNEFELAKLNLIRAIGVPLGQQIVLTDRMPVDSPAPETLDAALQAAERNRAELKRAEALLQAARYSIDAAHSEKLPTLDFAADYGTIGRTPTQNHGTYSMTGRIKIPVFNSNHRKTDEETAAARYEQRRLEAEDLKGRIEMEVRSAFLELQSASELVRVAQSSIELAKMQLDQAQDRFEAGVANNLEVVQAQEAVALADETMISSLYSLNVAKAVLARAMGIAEQTIKTYLGGKQ